MVIYTIPVSQKFDQKIELSVGDIITERVDALVVPADAHLTMVGGISERVKVVGGPTLEKEIEEHKKKRPKMFNLGEIIITSGGSLQAKYIFHAILPPLHARRGIRVSSADVYNLTIAILKEAINKGIKSIALPELGTTFITGLRPVTAARSMVNGLGSFLRDIETPLHISLVVSKRKFFNVYKNELEDQQMSLRKLEETATELKTRVEQILTSSRKDQVSMPKIVEELKFSNVSNILELLRQHPIPEFVFDWDDEVIKKAAKKRD